MPSIEDAYVDIEFGTGCLKVTPAHDENDKVLGDKHHLEVVFEFWADPNFFPQPGSHLARTGLGFSCLCKHR